MTESAPRAFVRAVGGSAGGGETGLMLVPVGVAGGTPGWTVLSDCTAGAQANAAHGPAPAPGQIRFAIRQLTYTFEAGQLKVSTPAAPAKAVLVDNVRNF